MLFAMLLFGPCSLNAITQFITSRIESIKLQMVIVQNSPLNDGELWMSYQKHEMMLSTMSDRSIKGENEEERLKFYITPFAFCLCNSVCPLQNLDQVGHVVSESGDLQY